MMPVVPGSLNGPACQSQPQGGQKGHNQPKKVRRQPQGGQKGHILSEEALQETAVIGWNKGRGPGNCGV